jgi:prepilin-type N-terminal cleavage/methylation domain-containing protein
MMDLVSRKTTPHVVSKPRLVGIIEKINGIFLKEDSHDHRSLMKNKVFLKRSEGLDGFSFIEVMLALLIVGSVLSSIFLLQQTVLDSVTNYAARWERIILLKKRLMQATIDRAKEGLYGASTKKTKEEIQKLQTTISYDLKKAPKDSALEKFPSIMIETASAQWQEWYGKRKETMISFLYKPEQKKS